MNVGECRLNFCVAFFKNFLSSVFYLFVSSLKLFVIWCSYLIVFILFSFR